jgi:hypothetical protein
MEEAFFMGFSGGFEQGKPATALPELIICISTKMEGVNP